MPSLRPQQPDKASPHLIRAFRFALAHPGTEVPVEDGGPPVIAAAYGRARRFRNGLGVYTSVYPDLSLAVDRFRLVRSKLGFGNLRLAVIARPDPAALHAQIEEILQGIGK